MADTQTTTSTVKLTAEFNDGSEVTITQNNPSNSNLAEKINAFSNFVKTNNVLISAKSDAQFNRIKQAVTRNVVETEYDLGI